MAAGLARAEDDACAALWKHVRGRLYTAVRDTNFEAGEPIWEIREDAAPGYRLEIRAAGDAHGAEVVLDAARARLTCQFSPRPADRWRFRVLRDGSALRRSKTLYRIGAAVDAILDRLAGTPPPRRARA